MTETGALLKKKGMRVTPQREAIYRLLAGNKGHPTAEHIFHEVKKAFPSISFNTVYKTLLSFEEAGLIQRFNTGQNIYRYDADVSAHPHFICLQCGRVDDMREYPDNVEDFIGKAERFSPGKMKFVTLHFYGYCPQCGNSDIKTHPKEDI